MEDEEPAPLQRVSAGLRRESAGQTAMQRLPTSPSFPKETHPHPIHIACIIGATGLVGRALLDQLLADPTYAGVRAFVRRPTGRTHAKLQEHVIDFSDTASWQDLVKGDVLFSTLGTTRAQAGGFAQQRVVDYDYQFAFAKAAHANNVHNYVLVSSVGANSKSMVPYSKMKGELERDVCALPFTAIHILRPGPLEGEREIGRPGERVGLALVGMFNKLGMFKHLKPVTGDQMARVMRKVALSTPHGQIMPPKIYEPADIAQILATTSA